MSEHSTIGWTDATWPIVAGCAYESPGCSNCWAVRDSWRLAHNPHAAVRAAFEGTVRKTDTGALVWTGLVRPLPERLDWPLHWSKARRVFVCSQSDLFHAEVPFDFIAATFGIMAMAPQHTFQVLTKHPGRALKFFEWAARDRNGPSAYCLWMARQICGVEKVARHELHEPPEWPLANVWFGVTVEDQTRADLRIPLLVRIPAEVRWISAEPLLERVVLGLMGALPKDYFPMYTMAWERIHWVVVGGESAQTRSVTRAFDLDWARAIKAECEDGHVDFFMKQLGTKPLPQALTGTVMRGPLPLPEGKTSRYKWHEPEHWPEDLRVQEFPA